jgi:iron complex outermembrane receptor protein
MGAQKRIQETVFMTGMFLFALAALLPQDTAQTLATVTVTVSRERSRSVLDLPYGLTRLIPDSLRPGLRNASIDERLFLLPGVTIASRNNPTQDPRISVRGFGSRSAFGVRGVRVLMDGIPLTLPDGQTALDYLDLESIGSLELIRGSASSLYGNAAGGVIDLRSRIVPQRRFTPTATAWMGSSSQQKLAAALGGRYGNSEYAISLSRTETDGYREHSRQEITNGSLRYVTELGGIRVAASFLGHDMPTAQNPGALTLAELQADHRDAEQLAIRRKARKEVSQVQAGLTLGTGNAEDLGELELVIHGGARDLNNPLQFAIVAVERATHGASLRAARNISLFDMPARITLGIDYQKQNDDRTEFTNCNEIPAPTTPTETCPIVGEERGTLRRDQREIVTGIGPFVRGEIELSSRVLLSAGARADRINFRVEDAFINVDNPDDSGERTLEAVSPMVGVVFKAAPLRSLYANFSSAFETPTATELGNKPDGSAGFNPELDPQRSSTFEAGSRGWIGAIFPSGLTYDVALYRTSVKDELIPFEIPGGQSRRFFRNAGSTSRTGFELALGTEVGPAELAASYSYSHFLFEDYEVAGTSYDENRIPGIPIQQLQGAVTVRRSGWYLTLEGEARGAVYMDDANTARSNAYEVMNVRLGGEGVVGLSWLSPRAGVQNVFDRRYAPSISVNATNGRYFEPAPGRIVYAGVTIGGFH